LGDAVTAETNAALATDASTARSTAATRKRRRGAFQRDDRTAWLMIAPMAVLLAIFVIYPLLYSFYLSTFELSFYKDPVFVGLQFYGYVLDSPKFWNSLSVGLRFALLVVPILMVMAFLMATLIKSLGKRMSGFLKTTIYLPTVVSFVVASIVFVFMYRAEGGLINGLLGMVGIGPYPFLADPDLALAAIAVPAIWIAFGVATLIMLAGILDIPDNYYEAAALEGATFLQQTRYITLPLLKNILLFLLVTGFVGAIQQIELPLVMTAGGPLESTTTPNLYIFNQFKDPTAYATSFSLTAALLLFIVLGTVSALIFRLVRSEKAVDG
jgi:ABC-type sugar transport system permease subunit